MKEEVREMTLPSGRTALVRKGKGRDLMRAHRAVAANPEPIAVEFALIAELVQLDGKPVVYEDVLAMELADVLALHAEVMGGGPDGANFPIAPAQGATPSDSPASARSSDSSASVSPSSS